MNRILMVLTSRSYMKEPGKQSGVWLGEFTDPYYEFLDAGFTVDLASPEGGQPPIDPRSRITENITQSNRRFNEDKKALEQFAGTYQLSQVDASAYDGLFFPGGHGPMWDLAQNENVGKLVLDFLDQKKPVAAICHGPAALVSAARLRPDLLQGIKVTAFSNTEEKLVMLYDEVPFLLEDKLKELGADYSSAFIPFTSKVIDEGLLITGQNPASAAPAAKMLIDKVNSQVTSHA